MFNFLCIAGIIDGHLTCFKFVTQFYMILSPGGGHLGKMNDGYVRALRVGFLACSKCTVRVERGLKRKKNAL